MSRRPHPSWRSPKPNRPAPPRLRETEREWIFREILRLYRNWWLTPGKCGTPNPWLSQEYGSHHTEGRLFARAYPEHAERLALEVLRDPEAPHAGRSYAWFVLGLLAPRTNPDIEQFLVEKSSDTAEDDEYDESQSALYCLAQRRFDERCLALCRTQCRQENSTAFYLLSQVVDPASIPLLKELTTWSEDHYYPIGAIPRNAEGTLEKIAVLQAADWEAKLQRYLLKWREESLYRETRWALATAERRGMKSLKATLEKRLNKARERGEPVRPSVSYPEDFDIDHILVAYAKAGGELRPEERKYLCQYGILGDSEERLMEIMAERSRYWRR